MKGEDPTIALNKPLGEVSFDRRRQRFDFASGNAGILSAQEHLLIQHHRLDRDVAVAPGALVRNTKWRKQPSQEVQICSPNVYSVLTQVS